MNITEKLYVKTRTAWRSWLKENHKKYYVSYIMVAKRHETRLRRLNKVIEALVQNKKPGFL
jgi:uncharacterized protein YdeI (YjbR/CyaY-like superfamily)